jgi:carboxypeptidase Taq
MSNKYDAYVALMQKIADVQYSSAVLQWDQEVYMPPKGAHYRARQLSTLAGYAHELATDNKLGGLLEDLRSNTHDLTPVQCANVVESYRVYSQQKKYTTAFVVELNECISQCFHAWQQAKNQKEFKLFEPYLEKLVRLKKQESELLGYEQHPYDAHLDLYETGLKTSFLDKLFSDVKQKLVPYIQQLFQRTQSDDRFLFQHYDKGKQWDFGLHLLRQLNYDFEAGRQDISTHPFTTNFSANDVRVTTRINENDLFEMIGSCIHECGHALYEQGLPADDYGLPSGSYLSLSIHESQSRLWENHVGKSIAFWEFNYSHLQDVFSEQLKTISLHNFYSAINTVKPSLIRTNADELTYHLHVLIRYEIEKELLSGGIRTSDLPEFWNEKYKSYLDIDVPSDDKGVLQDVHWSHGSFGYFPTYSLGSFYASQFFHTAQMEIPSLMHQIKNGNTMPLLLWLRTNIHKHGRTVLSNELCKNITGEILNFDYFFNYAKTKYDELYC